MSSAMRNASREVSRNGADSASRGAKAAPWTRKSRPSTCAPSASNSARDVLVATDVARQQDAAASSSCRGELVDVLLQPLVLVRQHEPRAGGIGLLRDGPGERPLVGDTDDEAGASREIRHATSSCRGLSGRGGCLRAATRVAGLAALALLRPLAGRVTVGVGRVAAPARVACGLRLARTRPPPPRAEAARACASVARTT